MIYKRKYKNWKKSLNKNKIFIISKRFLCKELYSPFSIDKSKNQKYTVKNRWNAKS